MEKEQIEKHEWGNPDLLTFWQTCKHCLSERLDTEDGVLYRDEFCGGLSREEPPCVTRKTENAPDD